MEVQITRVQLEVTRLDTVALVQTQQTLKVVKVWTFISSLNKEACRGSELYLCPVGQYRIGTQCDGMSLSDTQTCTGS